MGWNTSALFVRNRSISEVVASLPDVLEYVPTGQQVSADQAWSQSPGQRVYLADEGGWCQLWDPDQRFPPKAAKFGHADPPYRPRGMLDDPRVLAVLFS